MENGYVKYVINLKKKNNNKEMEANKELDVIYSNYITEETHYIKYNLYIFVFYYCVFVTHTINLFLVSYFILPYYNYYTFFKYLI